MLLKNLFKKNDIEEKSRLIVENNSPISEGAFTTEYLGLELYDDNVADLVVIGERVPVQKSYTFSTTEDDQDQIIIKLCRGKELIMNKVVRLGHFQVINIPKLPAREPSIQVTFCIDKEGISIMAKDLINTKYLEVIRINDN